MSDRPKTLDYASPIPGASQLPNWAAFLLSVALLVVLFAIPFIACFLYLWVVRA